ncbi:MAG: acyl-CoA dehydrogenase [Planktomarina sp.]
MPYRSAASEYDFIFDQVVPLAPVAKTDRFAEATPDMVAAVLTEGAKLCDDIMAPLRRVGDMQPARLENGTVITSPGFADAYKAIADGGWIGVAAGTEHGGMGLPMAVACAMHDMMSGANIALHLCPLLSQGQIEALEHHASDAIKDMYLPKLISGQWTGTMNLTEPQAGTDLGALASKAVPNGDGTYAVSGQKIFITWGEHDVAENICHLVLARLPDAAPGPKGISLFLVPKFIPNEDGSLGNRNDLRCVSLEHKMGIHGSPTAVMEYAGATGWLVGEEHKGLMAMFTMMNNARLSVGMQGIGVAEGAYQHALAYAMDRKQGRSMVEGGTGTIIDHADVRRMLMTMKADLFAARSIGAACAVAMDMATAQKEVAWSARAALLTPIAKSFGTDVGVQAADMGVQIHGGMGFIEETAAVQFLRDVRITPIYEGTNGIQAMDLVGRKMMDGGDAACALFDEIEAQIEAARPQSPNMADALWHALATLRETTEWMLDQEMNDRFAGSVPYQRAFARVLGGLYHLKAAQSGDAARVALARFYMAVLLPEHTALCVQAKMGAAPLYAMTPDDFAH